MRKIIMSALLLSVVAAPVEAQAQVYPVQGRWGQSSNTEQGAIDCAGKRVIEFTGNQRTDSEGGVPAFRNQSVTPDGPSSYRIVDEFSTGQISAGQTTYGLRKIDADHIEMNMQDGGSVKLQRCR
ncbi:MAG TPA: hypothetical protein VLU23_16215 [Pseudolabrys sp.]|jgi:hypothetical protein|nr:hypothetical protein [Pseudolabrys sp.]